MSVEIKTMDLSFCSDGAHNVVNSEAKDYIINRLKNKHDIDITKKHAFILNSKSIYFLEKTQHILSIKSSGTNYYLYFTNINNINYCFYIDRKIKSGYTYPRIISVKYSFDDTIFQDTLLDGELVRDINDNDSWIFLITDMLIHKGKKLDCNIINRFNTMYDMLTHDYNKNNELDICPLVVKKLFMYKEYDYLITKFIPSLPYKTNGIYFNSLNTKHANQLYLFKNNNNTHHQKKKSYHKKQDNGNSEHGNSEHGNSEHGNSKKTDIILQIKPTDKSDIYELYCSKRNEPYNIGMACIPNLRTSKLIRKLTENTQSDIFVKCKYNEKFKKYEPLYKSETNNLSDISIIKS